MSASEDSANTDRQQTFSGSIEDLQQTLETEELQQTLVICTLHKDSGNYETLRDENVTKRERHTLTAVWKKLNARDDLPRELVRRSEAERKQAPQSEANAD